MAVYAIKTNSLYIAKDRLKRKSMPKKGIE